MDYMTSSQQFFKHLTEGMDVTDAGKAAKEVSSKVSNWITSQVWDPIKKYGTIALAIVLSLITLAVCLPNRRSPAYRHTCRRQSCSRTHAEQRHGTTHGDHVTL